MVNLRATILAELLARWDGVITAAPELTRAAATLEHAPIETWMPTLDAAIQADLGDIPQELARFPLLAAAAKLSLARRLGWTVDMLSRVPGDPKRARHCMEVAMRAVAVWSPDGELWTALQPKLPGGGRVAEALEAVIRGRSSHVGGVDEAPVYEREHLEALSRADAASAWPELVETSVLFQRLPTLDSGARAATLALLVLDRPRLVSIARGAKTWMQAHLVLGALPLVDALRVATSTDGGHARFAALERVAHRERRRLNETEDRALRNLLLALSVNDGWREWLQVFNKYPVRCPHIQLALGRALARCGSAALKTYVDSMSLGIAEDGGRIQVTQCLKVFRANADAGRRRMLWQAAFDRWATWNYGLDDGTGLTKIARCELDYGVVGCLIEANNAESFENPDQRFDRELRHWDSLWHRSRADAQSAFFRLLSEYQIRAHAQHRAVGDVDWTLDSEDYRPPALASNFAAQRYGSI